MGHSGWEVNGDHDQIFAPQWFVYDVKKERVIAESRDELGLGVWKTSSNLAVIRTERGSSWLLGDMRDIKEKRDSMEDNFEEALQNREGEAYEYEVANHFILWTNT